MSNNVEPVFRSPQTPAALAYSAAVLAFCFNPKKKQNYLVYRQLLSDVLDETFVALKQEEAARPGPTPAE